MNRVSPATRLHDLVVVNDQSGVEWRAGIATIDDGRIVIAPASTQPPRTLFASRASTFTISALDGGERLRRFANVTLDHQATIPRQRYVFA